MVLVINNELLSKCGGGSDEYWFSYKDYSVKNINQFNTDDKPDDVGQTEYFVSIGIIPFVSISNEEIMRGFVKEKGSKKLNTILDDVKSEDFIETFWKYFNAYPELKDGLDDFARDYIINKVQHWCNENKVNFTLDL